MGTRNNNLRGRNLTKLLLLQRRLREATLGRHLRSACEGGSRAERAERRPCLRVCNTRTPEVPRISDKLRGEPCTQMTFSGWIASSFRRTGLRLCARKDTMRYVKRQGRTRDIGATEVLFPLSPIELSCVGVNPLAQPQKHLRLRDYREKQGSDESVECRR